MPWYDQLYTTERNALQEKGIKFVKFSGEDSKRFHSALEDEWWKGMEQKLGGDKEYIAKLRKLAGK